MDVALADASVRAADADVLVRAAEAAHHVTLEVRQNQQRVIVQHGLADVHLRKPLAALDRKRGNALGVRDVHRAERPAVDLQRLAMLFGGIAAALIVRVGLDDRRVRQTGFDQLSDPWSGDDIGALRLAGVQLDRHLAGQHRGNLVIDLLQTRFGKIAGEEHHGTLARAILKRYILVAVLAGNRFVAHMLCPPSIDV